MQDYDALVEELLTQYVYHRGELVRRAGGKTVPDARRLKALNRPSIEKMASAIFDWSIKPDVVMAAVFDLARRNKHPNGPFPNLLGSVKHLTQAVSNYLQIPYEVVAENRGLDAFLGRMDDEFCRVRGELERAGVTDIVSATSYPVEFRYLMAVTKFDKRAAFFLAQDVLRAMSEDRRIGLWLNHRGIKYEAVASHFNKMKDQA